MCFFSFGMYVALIIMPDLYFVNPNIPILWISVMPADWRNFWTISLAFFVDTLVFFVLLMWNIYIIFPVLSFIMTFPIFTQFIIRKIIREGGNSNSNTTNDDDGREISFELVKETLEDFRELETQLKFFNLVMARVLWITKLDCLMMSILGGFSAIRIAHTNPLLAVIYAILFVEFIICYTVLFQLAYGVPEKAEELRRVIGLTSAGLKSPLHRKHCEKVLSSIPMMALRVGGFHTIERESVPIFADFVVQQIVGLLLLLR